MDLHRPRRPRVSSVSARRASPPRRAGARPRRGASPRPSRRRRRATTSASWPSGPWPSAPRGLLPAGPGHAGPVRCRRAPAPDPGARRQARAHHPAQRGDGRRRRRRRRLRGRPAQELVRDPRQGAGAGRRASRSCSSASTSTAPATRPTRARACSSPGCSPSTASSSASLRAMAGKAVGRRAPQPDDHRAGGCRPRQAHNRSRLARRAMTMRRTTLAVVSRRRRGPRPLRPRPQALNVYAATSLTNVFPALNKGPTYSFGGSNTLQLQIERGAPADVFASASPTEAQTLFQRGPLHAPGDLRHQPARAADPELQPGQHHLGLLAALRRAQAVDRDRRGAHRRLHAPAAQAHAAVVDPQLQHRQPADQRRARSPRRSRWARPTPASSTTPTAWR